MGRTTANTPIAFRCAVYTRKSTEDGLEQEFNSLDAQRDAGEAYIASQKSEGWVCLPDKYDDGGFTGGNMDRPALQRLLADIEVGKVDCIVVYKVDQLREVGRDSAVFHQAIHAPAICGEGQHAVSTHFRHVTPSCPEKWG
jgi:DNA invertase Pin-like site-specific DNA recombinase